MLTFTVKTVWNFGFMTEIHVVMLIRRHLRSSELCTNIYSMYYVCMCVFVCMYVRVYVANFTEQSDISEMLLVCTSSPDRFATVKIIRVFAPVSQQHYS
jgi:hypothetical protein